MSNPNARIEYIMRCKLPSSKDNKKAPYPGASDLRGRPRGCFPSFGGFPALRRDAAAFSGLVREPISPMIFPAPHLQAAQDSTCSRNRSMFQEPSAASIPRRRGEAPQKSLIPSLPALTRGGIFPAAPGCSGAAQPFAPGPESTTPRSFHVWQRRLTPLPTVIL